MRSCLFFLAAAGAFALPTLPAIAQSALLPSDDVPMNFSPGQCNALNEIQGDVATRSAQDIERIGAAMAANRNADPRQVARISGLSMPTVETMGAMDPQSGMAFTLAFGSMLRQYHPELLMRVLREYGPLGQLPDISDNPLGMAVLDNMLNTAQQNYQEQCS